MPNRIVLIDDEIKLLKVLKKALELDGHEVCEFSSPTEALNFITERNPALVISDIRMPGMTGLDLLAELSKLQPSPPCILMTAYSSLETAVTAVRLGARDYLLKPFEIEELRSAVCRVIASTKTQISTDLTQYQFTGNSDAICKVIDIIKRSADTASSVLIQGESGSGKELAARMLHSLSRRSKGPFVSVSCGVVSESMIESELFGYVQGAVKGGFTDKDGLFAEAYGGTLFFDEIGDLSLGSQAKLLKTLQEGIVKKLGSTRPISIETRIVASTTRNLHTETTSGNFREDLLYKLGVIEIYIPPLRDRIEDIPMLVEHFLKRFSETHNRNLLTPSKTALSKLSRYTWPGNVRELENVIERAVILKRNGDELLPEDLQLPATDLSGMAPADFSKGMQLEEVCQRFEKELIRRALENTSYNYSQAAEMLGITRQNLYYKLRKHGLHRGNQ